MTKAPIAGSVKTRLVPPLTYDEAARLSRCFVADVAENIHRVMSDHRAHGIAIYTPSGEEAAFRDLLPESFMLLTQRGGDLGERLSNAATDLFTAGFGAVCLINADGPTLPSEFISTALAALEREGDRVVLGAADDGGYYLIGLKQSHPRLFDQINWSTSRVFEQSLARVRELALEAVLLPKWYDVDDSKTLDRLCQDLFQPDHRFGNGHRPYDAKRTHRFLAEVNATERIARSQEGR